MGITKDQRIARLVEDLSAASRRRRQEVAHDLAVMAREDPKRLVVHIGALVDALERPEAQTRWEVLDALSALVEHDADEVAKGFEGAEASLFDDTSATVRLSAFVYLCRLGSSTPARSDEVWPLLDEAIQCYHGDAEYRDMLAALLRLAQAGLSDETKKKLVERVSFDAQNASGYIQSFSTQIVQTLS